MLLREKREVCGSLCHGIPVEVKGYLCGAGCLFLPLHGISGIELSLLAGQCSYLLSNLVHPKCKFPEEVTRDRFGPHFVGVDFLSYFLFKPMWVSTCQVH